MEKVEHKYRMGPVDVLFEVETVRSWQESFYDAIVLKSAIGYASCRMDYDLNYPQMGHFWSSKCSVKVVPGPLMMQVRMPNKHLQSKLLNICEGIRIEQEDYPREE